MGGFAEDDAVAGEQLLGDRRGSTRSVGGCALRSKAAALSAQRPCAVGGVVRRRAEAGLLMDAACGLRWLVAGRSQ